MRIILDAHLHSRFSRATSPNMNVDGLFKWAKYKGIDLIGTGDFTHPFWLAELKEKLNEDGSGLLKLKNVQNNKDPLFILTSEISAIYTQGNKVRKIHLVIFSPSFEVVDKINQKLEKIGNLYADGRPIFGASAKELSKIILDICQDCLIVPAHCLLPKTYIHSNPRIKMIKNISTGDLVYTHEGRLKKVKKVYKRFYKGPIYNIKPYYFRLGLQTTLEHPFYVIKTDKNCSNFGKEKHVYCRKTCSYIKKKRCLHPYFENYQPQWIQAKEIEKGDVLVFPRFNNNTKNIGEIKLSGYLNKNEYKLVKNLIKPNGSRTRLLPNVIKIDKEFCRLMGYYVSEGYTDNRDSISFCFNRDEKNYVKDLKFLIKKVFGLSSPRIYKRKNTGGIEIIYFSKILAKVFSKLFYKDATAKKAHTKSLPVWALNLPLQKQVEILKGWWWGDSGYTSSRILMNQMKMIFLRLGIIPSIYGQSKEDFNEKYTHKYKRKNRIIKARYNSFSLNRLSFFQDLFGLLKNQDFKKFETKLTRRHGWIDRKYIYIPVRDIEVKNYEGDVYNLEVEDDNSYTTEFAVVHNCWTPWFAIFGSNSGFDSVEECFGELSPKIYALETGLSSNPEMNWRLSKLDRYTLVSFSDAHSPGNLGREATVFDLENFSYQEIYEALKNKDSKKILYTIEFFPEEGKYHFDGHRMCGISLSPEESKKFNNKCPKCGRPLTIGVMHRVIDLADRKENFVPENAIPYKSLVPLDEIIAESLDQQPTSKAVLREYLNLVQQVAPELPLLLDAPLEELKGRTLPQIIEGIKKVREGQVEKIPGYDGVYGIIKLKEGKSGAEKPRQQKLF